jgi:MFS family permease
MLRHMRACRQAATSRRDSRHLCRRCDLRQTRSDSSACSIAHIGPFSASLSWAGYATSLSYMLNRFQLMLTSSFITQTWDAFDFFTVSLTVSNLATTFGKSATDITWGITLVLMFRSVGSILFGIAADRYGRKWPFIVNNILFIVLELVSSWALVVLLTLADDSFSLTTGHRLLPDIPAVPGLPCAFWRCHGRIVRQCSGDCARRSPC